MSKKSLNLATAIANFQKGKESRDIKLTEKEIAKFIDGQIKTKQEEVEELKVTMSETSDENYEDFKESLVTGLDGKAIKERSNRQSTAQSFCLTAIQKLVTNGKYTETVQTDINKLEAEIKLFKQLRTELENITVEVEKED